MTWQATYELWQQYPDLDSQLREALSEMTLAEQEEAFTGTLSFGTAGMRGVMGPGTNRMNIYAVRQATEGLAQFIEAQGSEAKQRGVAIAYDSRHDSNRFAMEAAQVLGAHGIQSYVYESLRPTPVLSFAVRETQAIAGIMITASHNPAEYNGYKVYGEDGGQFPPEAAAELTEYVRQVQDPLKVPVGDKTDLLGSGMIEILGERMDQAYLQAMRTVTVNPSLIESMSDEIQIVFTPLHGAGYAMGMKAMEQAGFQHIHTVDSQRDPDGAFPTVTSPNPEEASAFEEAHRLAESVDADIALATDPDADRLGALVRREDGTYQLLTGNQIACLMLAYLLEAKQQAGTLPEDSVVVKSMVSTALADRICEHYGVKMIEVLTGFKFIAEKIQQYEEDQTPTFLMGFEESYGYLIQPFVRDKDAIQVLVLLAELTAYHKKQGRTLGEALDQLYTQFGYYQEKTISVAYPGLDGSEKMRQIMERIRQERPVNIGQWSVMESLDYLTGERVSDQGVISPMTYPPSDALKYRLEDGSWIALRPSGTEPKIKLYIGATGTSEEEVAKKVEALENALQQLTA